MCPTQCMAAKLISPAFFSFSNNKVCSLIYFLLGQSCSKELVYAGHATSLSPPTRMFFAQSVLDWTRKTAVFSSYRQLNNIGGGTTFNTSLLGLFFCCSIVTIGLLAIAGLFSCVAGTYYPPEKKKQPDDPLGFPFTSDPSHLSFST